MPTFCRLIATPTPENPAPTIRTSWSGTVAFTREIVCALSVLRRKDVGFLHGSARSGGPGWSAIHDRRHHDQSVHVSPCSARGDPVAPAGPAGAHGASAGGSRCALRAGARLDGLRPRVRCLHARRRG